MKDYAIGEEFLHNGVMLRVVDDRDNRVSCDGCFLDDQKYCEDTFCCDNEREDGTDVIFEKVEAQ